MGRETSLAIEKCHKRLQSLGPERSHRPEQRNYLLKVSTEFQSLTAHALDAYYARDECFVTHSELRLATIIKSLQEKYSTKMRAEGHTRKFLRGVNHRKTAQPDPSAAQINKDLENSANLESLSSGSDVDEAECNEFSLLSLAAISPEKEMELRLALAVSTSPSDRPREDIMTWIRREYNSSKGFEIGTVNPSLLRALFHEQTKYWRYYTTEHINEVIMATHTFIIRLLDYLCPDSTIREPFWALLGKEVMASYGKAVDHVDLLLKIEERGNMRSLNHYFATTLKKRRQNRLRKRLGNSKSWATNDDKRETLLRLDDIVDTYISNDDQTVEDLHDVLYSYYKLARKQFVDAVAKCPIDYFLLTVDDGPLKVCSPEFVGRLSDNELEQIAGESNESSRRRADILQQLRTLNDAQEILRK